MNVYNIEATWKRRVVLTLMFLPTLIGHMVFKTPLMVFRCATIVWRKRDN